MLRNFHFSNLWQVSNRLNAGLFDDDLLGSLPSKHSSTINHILSMAAFEPATENWYNITGGVGLSESDMDQIPCLT
jgi:hypothetical protein